MIYLLKIIAALFAGILAMLIVDHEITKYGLQVGISSGFGLVQGSLLLKWIWTDKKL